MKECIAEECNRKAVCKGCCDRHYRRLLKNGSIHDSGSRIVDVGDEVERFHQKYEVNDRGCWIWTGGTRPNGKGVLYGRHWRDEGSAIGAHRFSYMIHFSDPKDSYVCHKCDTPLCVNPDHLFMSDHHGNMRDMVDKERSCKDRGERKWGTSKLTNDQAEKIRLESGSQSKIAAKYGVAQTTISRIKRGVSY